MKHNKRESIEVIRNILSIISNILVIIVAVVVFVYQVKNPVYVSVIEIFKCLSLIFLPSKNIINCIDNSKNIRNNNLIYLILILIIQVVFCALAVSFPICILFGKITLSTDKTMFICQVTWLLSKFPNGISVVSYYSINLISQIVESVSQICFIFSINKETKE